MPKNKTKNKKIQTILLIFISLFSVTALGLGVLSGSRYLSYSSSSAAAGPLANASTYSELLGVTHVGGYYRLTNKPFFNEGVDAVKETGAKTIGLWMGPSYNTSFEGIPALYPNSNWSTKVKSLKELAQTEQFRKAFSDPSISTYVLTAYPFSSFSVFYGAYNNPMNSKVVSKDTDELRALAEYVSSTYRNKLFIIKQWEGDWQLLGTEDRGASISDKRVEAMVNWLNKRQEAVALARQKTRINNVFNAAEFNFVRKCDSKKQNCTTTGDMMLTRVLPYVAFDMVSYSAWQTTDTMDPKIITDDIQYIKNHPATKSKPLLISEFGVSGFKASANFKLIAKSILDAGVFRALYWQIYDNTCGLVAPENKVQVDPNCEPLGLVDLNGHKTTTWDVFSNTVHDTVTQSNPLGSSLVVQGYDATTRVYSNEVYSQNYLILYGNFSSSGNRVYVGDTEVNKSYESPSQINVLLPGITGTSLPITVVSDSGQRSMTYATILPIKPKIYGIQGYDGSYTTLPRIGQYMVIYGVFGSDLSKVTVNGVEQIVAGQVDTQINAILDSSLQPGSADVVVITPNGRSEVFKTKITK